MKKLYFLLFPVLLLTGYAAQSQCLFSSAFGTATISVNNNIVTISTCSFAGEYSTINGAINGQTLQFTSSVGTDFITIRSGTFNGPVVAFGQTPLSFANTFTGTLFAHWSTNAACGTQATCRTTTVQCTSCPPVPPPPDPCLSITNIAACATPVTTVHSGAGIWNVPACGFSTPGQERVYTFTPAITGLYNLNVTAIPIGGFLDYYYKPASGGCNSSGWICIDDNAAVGTDPIGILTGGTQYYILVDDETTAPTTHVFNISCAIPPIPNDLCTGALPIACGGSVSGTTVGATIDPVGTCVTPLNTAPGIWYTFVGNGATNTLSTCGGATWDTKIGVFTGTCAALVCVTGNDDFCALQSQVTFPTTLGTTYYVIVTGFGTATGAFTMTRTSAPLPNDLCTGAININCGQTITGSTACGATIDAVGTCVTPLGTAPGLWYSMVGDGSSVTLSLCGSAYDTKIGVFSGTCTGLVCVTGNDDFCGLQSQVTFTANATVTYYILVTGFSTNTGNFTLTRTCAPICAGVPSPGAIAPATTTTCVGDNVTLTCSGYSGNSGLTFQWSSAPAAAGPYTNIAGATSNIYTFAAPATTTYYRCTVTCSVGGGNSTTAPVVVNVSNIQFTATAATPSTVCSPGSVTITGTVTGGQNLGNYTFTLTGAGTIGAPVYSGPNNSSVSFSVTNIPAGNQVYTMTATDPVPCSKNTTINVTVNLTPVVTLAPAVATICNGNILPITGTVTTGAGTFVFSPLTELFTDAGATVAYTGAALASGTIIYARPTVTRTYTATVTSAQGCVSTTPITITVNQLPAIVTPPLPATQTVCPGVSVNYTVVATGTGLTYQWRRNGTNLVDGVQISGATTPTLTIGNVAVANNGTYDCVVSGVCPPPAISAGAVLSVAAPPTVSTPTNQTICSIPTAPTILLNNTTAIFTSTATGTPTPAIFQWQVSTTGAGGPWTNLANSATASASPFYGGVFTTSLTITNAPVSLNGNLYRLVATNSCGQTTNGLGGTLTVNASPLVTATDLFARRICWSDTLVPLVGTPVGGAWSGIGVSGFNFVPGATGLGGPYLLTYTYTNASGCTVSDTTRVVVQDCPERLRELTDEGAVTIFPNPSNGRFNIRLNSTLYNYLGVRTYDMNGRLMVGTAVEDPVTKRDRLVTPTYTGLYYGRTIPIDLSHLASGTYLLVIYYDDGVRTSKKGFEIVIMR